MYLYKPSSTSVLFPIKLKGTYYAYKQTNDWSRLEYTNASYVYRDKASVGRYICHVLVNQKTRWTTISRKHCKCNKYVARVSMVN